MRFFDTHIHLTDLEGESATELVARLRQNGIEKCVCVSARPKDWEKVAQMAHDFPLVITPAFGLHPWYIDEAPKDFINFLEKFIAKFPSAAIGECGFDKLKNPNLEQQKEFFDPQLELAVLHKRPLILHTLKADEIMQKYDAFLPSNAIFHSYSGSIERLKQILKFDIYLSVNKKFFNKKDAAPMLQIIPQDKLLIETDAPYQSGISDLKEVVERIAEIQNLPTDSVAHQLYLNAEEVFAYD